MPYADTEKHFDFALLTSNGMYIVKTFGLYIELYTFHFETNTHFQGHIHGEELYYLNIISTRIEKEKGGSLN